MFLPHQGFLWLSATFATMFSVSGGGYHSELLTKAERTDVYFWYWMWSLPAGCILSMPNMAVVSLLCRLFKPPPWHKAVLWTIAIVCNANYLFGFVLALFRCWPLRKPWDVGDERPTECWDPWVYIRYFFYAAGS